MVKKLIVFDIDGTLINECNKVLSSTKKAIAALNIAGHDTVIATGRNAAMAKPIIDELNFHQYIVCNGAEAFSKHESIFKNPLNHKAVHRLLKLADELDHPIVYETAHNILRRSKIADSRIIDGMKYVGASVPEYDESERFHLDNELTQLLLFNDEASEPLYLSGDFPEFRFVRWYMSGVDVLPANGSKFETITHFSQYKNYQMKDVITFGDGNNDIEMIEGAGIGVAMGNAVPAAKEVSDIVTDSNNEDGIYKALKKLSLI